ncbi:MAG: HPr family phosphocarrier protein [Kiritimatiellae bacterium]|jgi:phosphotransferase system HPr (HPr) family protein|nr:HPr family phosphocarrier protein [Kiritimatiellia bacterium]
MEKKLEIKNQYGIHARPAALIVGIASRCDGEVWVVKNDDDAISAKSIMGLITLEASVGTVLTFTIDDSVENAEQILDELEELLHIRKFDED